jgi:hypothetical protein
LSGRSVERASPVSRAIVLGRRLFDLTDGWGGRPAGGEHAFVVTHEVAIREGLVDQVVYDLVAAVLGGGRPFLGTGGLGAPVVPEDPRIVPCRRVTHLVHDIRR